jgi:hypothetical protein
MSSYNNSSRNTILMVTSTCKLSYDSSRLRINPDITYITVMVQDELMINGSIFSNLNG